MKKSRAKEEDHLLDLVITVTSFANVNQRNKKARVRGRGSDAAAAQRQRVTESEAFFFSLFPFLVLLLICSRCVFRERREAGECFFRCAFWRGKKGESVEERGCRETKKVDVSFISLVLSLACLWLSLSHPNFARKGRGRHAMRRLAPSPHHAAASPWTSAAAPPAPRRCRGAAAARTMQVRSKEKRATRRTSSDDEVNCWPRSNPVLLIILPSFSPLKSKFANHTGSSSASPGCHGSEKRNKRRRRGERCCNGAFVFGGVGGIDSFDGCGQSPKTFGCEGDRLCRGPLPGSPASARPG